MLTSRRWPYVTTILIAIQLLIFLSTHRTLQREANQYIEVESRTLSLAAVYPTIPVSAAQKAMIDAFRESHSQDWELMTQKRAETSDLAEIAGNMTDLGRQLDNFQSNSLTARFAVYPPRRSAASRFTANFLHRDWWHLIFNICFLWLVGGTLEDVWGRSAYTLMLALCCLFGVWAYAITYQGNLIPLIGASGMLATLVGFYVVRFPKIKIERGTALWVVRPHLLRFSSPVYIVFPLWLLGLMFWGKSAVETNRTAYWAQGCAFGVGVVLAFALRVSGIESYVSKKVEAEAAWSVDPHIAAASEHLQKGNLDSAIDEVNLQISEKPSSVEAHEMLVSLYFRKGDAVIKYLKALEALCEVHVKAANPEAAWLHYENYLEAGGRKMPAATWFQLARFAENQGDWERAITEYEEFAKSWPDERTAVLALISAGRIQLQQFGRRDEAKRLYTAAQNSRAPHADWNDVICRGLENVGRAAQTTQS